MRRKFALLIILTSFMAYAGCAHVQGLIPASPASKKPGPSFEKWEHFGAIPNWHHPLLTLHTYVDRSKNPPEVGMEAIWLPTGEAVVRGWGVYYNGTYHRKNAFVAIKTKEGNWLTGAKGLRLETEPGPSFMNSAAVSIFVTTDTAERVGRTFYSK